MPLSDADAAMIPDVEKFIGLIKKDRQILHDPRVAAITKMLASLGIQLPPAPQPKAAAPAAKPAAAAAAADADAPDLDEDEVRVNCALAWRLAGL
jgi:hypothetical protein